MERQFRKAYGEKGPSGVAIIGSGQYTIQEGYVAAKLMKAGFRSNNIDPNARHCMASAVAAFMQTFGIDEPANVYDDIELADTMVLWGANMAEAHPILWSRITDRKLAAKATKVVNLTTYRNMSVRPRGPRDRDGALLRPRDPELHRARDRRPQRGELGLREEALRLRDRARPTSATACGPPRSSPTTPRRTRRRRSSRSPSARPRPSASAASPARRSRRRTAPAPASTG